MMSKVSPAGIFPEKVPFLPSAETRVKTSPETSILSPVSHAGSKPPVSFSESATFVSSGLICGKVTVICIVSPGFAATALSEVLVPDSGALSFAQEAIASMAININIIFLMAGNLCRFHI